MVFPGLVFCLLLEVSSDYAQPITGQVTEVTCPVIGRPQPELTSSKTQKTGPVLVRWHLYTKAEPWYLGWATCDAVHTSPWVLLSQGCSGQHYGMGQGYLLSMVIYTIEWDTLILTFYLLWFWKKISQNLHHKESRLHLWNIHVTSLSHHDSELLLHFWPFATGHRWISFTKGQ